MHRMQVLLAFFILSASSGQETKLTPAPKLQGKWEVAEMNMAGDQVNPKIIFGGVTWEFRDDILTITLGKREVIHKINIDDKKEPAWLNLYPQDPMYKGNVCAGIFKFEGDVLVVCNEVRGKGPRPKDFRLPDLASGCTLNRLKRMK